MEAGTSTGGSEGPCFRGARQSDSGGVWENALQPVRGVLDRPSASSPEFSGADEIKSTEGQSPVEGERLVRDDIDQGERRRDRQGAARPDQPDQAGAFQRQSAGRPLKRSPDPGESPVAFVPPPRCRSSPPRSPAPAHPDSSLSRSLVPAPRREPILHNPFAPFSISTLRTGCP